MTRIKKTVLLSSAGILMVALLVMEMLKTTLFAPYEYGDNIYIVLTRMAGGVACLLFMRVYMSQSILSFKTTLKAFLIFLPCMAVAVNNFPFIPFLGGDAYISSKPIEIILYALACLSVGFFEEMAFRGCIFTVVLERTKKNAWGVFVAIFISSAIFGIVHLVNVMAGGSVGAVILQVCYSFLIGGMCSVILVKTSNIWYCVLLHAVYNFAGGVVPECGGGMIWTAPEIALTTVVAVIVTVYVIFILTKTTEKDIDRLLN